MMDQTSAVNCFLHGHVTVSCTGPITSLFWTKTVLETLFKNTCEPIKILILREAQNKLERFRISQLQPQAHPFMQSVSVLVVKQETIWVAPQPCLPLRVILSISESSPNLNQDQEHGICWNKRTQKSYCQQNPGSPIHTRNSHSSQGCFVSDTRIQAWGVFQSLCSDYISNCGLRVFVCMGKSLSRRKENITNTPTWYPVFCSFFLIWFSAAKNCELQGMSSTSTRTHRNPERISYVSTNSPWKVAPMTGA